jgi:two-component system CheB/CheR fusion protein
VGPVNLPDLSGLTILVVDDNDDNLDMLGTYLRACRADVLQARNALTALSYLETHSRIDALVTDLSMPNIDGLQLLQRIRAHPRGRTLPAIALTGFYEKYMDTHAAGFKAFLRKPVNFDELCGAIRSVVRAD